MEQVRAFRTTDGQVFLDQQEAAQHEQQLLFAQWCKDHMYRDIEANEVATLILEHWSITPKPGMVPSRYLPQEPPLDPYI